MADLIELAERVEAGEADMQPVFLAAMRAFEPLSPILRYPEARGWHACDRMAMRYAIAAALRALAAKEPS